LTVFVLSIAHRLSIMQNLRDVAKSLEAVEKLNKLKVKTINALHAIPSVPHRVLNDVVAAVDSDDIKEIAGQFITKAAPLIRSRVHAIHVCSPGEVLLVSGISSASRTRGCSCSELAHGPPAPVDIH
jgi:hypothetical protein